MQTSTMPTSSMPTSAMPTPAVALSVELSPGKHANSSANEWGFDVLPSNVTFVNATMNGTIVNGRLYNGSDSSIMSNDTTIVHTLNSNNIGNVSLISFIYIVMSCVVILVMLPQGLLLIRAATNNERSQGSATNSAYTERIFRKDLEECYPEAPPTTLWPSYPELVDEKRDGQISHKDIEWCKTLLRGKHLLDRQVLSLSHVRREDRRVVDGMVASSAGAVQELHGIAKTWMKVKDQWTAEEWELVQKICQQISTIGNKGR
jgi:hypothetical protein